MVNPTFKVYNRRLEQVLFYLGVDFLSCDKDDEGMTYWTYAKTQKTETIVNMFKDATEKRRKVGW